MNQKIIWGVTLGAVLLMLAGAFIYAQKGTPAAQPAAPTKQAPAAVITAAPAPVDSQPSTTPPAQPAASSAAAPVYDEVKIDLSRIAGTLQMSSPQITATATGELPRYPIELTCYRRNASPGINWGKAPAATKSYVLALERRAPDEKASWPWIIYNIPAGTQTLAANITSETIGANGVFGTNPYGHQAYTGPCEPKGTYPYILRLLALDRMLDVKAGATMQELLPLINGHVIDAAEIRAQHYRQM
jgi:Raf kinase inhibitor-like YbhB/YbcL family protein